MALVPPGGPMEILFSFDTTGSMSSILDEVRGRLNDMIQRLQADIPSIKLAVFAHGDYCDLDMFGYVTKHVDFTDNVHELCEFVNNVSGTGGGDFDECYELVLRQVQDLSWAENSQKSLVLIGDATPHEADYHLNVDHINWREELKTLAEKGIKVYAVQCMEESESDDFYRTLADSTGGHHLKLNQFSNIFDFIMAICYHEKGAEFLHDYEAEVRARNARMALNKDLENLFGELRNPMPALVSPPESPAVLAKVPSVHAAPRPIVAGKKGPVKNIKVRVDASAAKPRRVGKKPVIKKIKSQPFAADKLDRDKVFQTDFLLNTMTWSSWKLAISAESDYERPAAWRKRNNTSNYRRRYITSDSSRRAIYEFSIQTRKGCRRRVTYFKVTNGFENPGSWETTLLRGPSVRQEINNALSSGCKVFVRRSVLSRSQTIVGVRQQLKKVYKYTWLKSKKDTSDISRLSKRA